jgi:hypothetical protein
MLDSLSNRRIQQRTIIQIHSAEIQHLYFLEDTMRKAISLIGLLMTLAIPSGLFAQQAGYFLQKMRPASAWTPHFVHVLPVASFAQRAVIKPMIRSVCPQLFNQISK